MARIRTFYHGDTIRVVLSLYDDSGVAHVVGVFAHTKPGRFSHRDPASRYEDIWLHGEGQGKSRLRWLSRVGSTNAPPRGSTCAATSKPTTRRATTGCSGPTRRSASASITTPTTAKGQNWGVALSGRRRAGPPVVVPHLRRIEHPAKGVLSCVSLPLERVRAEPHPLRPRLGPPRRFEIRLGLLFLLARLREEDVVDGYVDLVDA